MRLRCIEIHPGSYSFERCNEHHSDRHSVQQRLHPHAGWTVAARLTPSNTSTPVWSGHLPNYQGIGAILRILWKLSTLFWCLWGPLNYLKLDIKSFILLLLLLLNRIVRRQIKQIASSIFVVKLYRGEEMWRHDGKFEWYHDSMWHHVSVTACQRDCMTLWLPECVTVTACGHDSMSALTVWQPNCMTVEQHFSVTSGQPYCMLICWLGSKWIGLYNV